MKEHGSTEEEELPNFFVTAQNIDPFKRVEMQGIWQNHIDASISSTVNLPNSATIEEVEGLYMHAWKQGLKGMTIFRDGCDRAAILSTGKPKEENKEEVKENVNEVARGVVVPTSDDVIGLKKKLAGGCGSLHLQVYFDRTTGKMSEVFINKGGTGGCNSNLNALSRMISIALRAGVDVKDVSDQLASTINCPSFASSRAKGINLSPGTSCASAVGRALIDLNKEFQIMFKAMKHVEEDMEEDELMGLEICPECGAKALEMSGGCQVCKECGMSKCD
jgi:ribonucleoside-diphosphate reductase alpha chain